MERVLRKILNNSLGDFFENISSNDVKVGIFSGKVQLKNLKLKPSIMERLGLPIKLISGLIGNIFVDVT
jgi:hypothetical protein